MPGPSLGRRPKSSIASLRTCCPCFAICAAWRSWRAAKAKRYISGTAFSGGSLRARWRAAVDRSGVALGRGNAAARCRRRRRHGGGTAGGELGARAGARVGARWHRGDHGLRRCRRAINRCRCLWLRDERRGQGVVFTGRGAAGGEQRCAERERRAATEPRARQQRRGRCGERERRCTERALALDDSDVAIATGTRHQVTHRSGKVARAGPEPECELRREAASAHSPQLSPILSGGWGCL